MLRLLTYGVIISVHICAASKLDVPRVPTRPTFRGVASWYGPGFYGRKTANGENFRKDELTAAHKTLPLGTRLLVKNVENSKSVVVRINDRGPYVQGRMLDLSYAAAKTLGILDHGTGHVQIQIISKK